MTKSCDIFDNRRIYADVRSLRRALRDYRTHRMGFEQALDLIDTLSFAGPFKYPHMKFASPISRMIQYYFSDDCTHLTWDEYIQTADSHMRSAHRTPVSHRARLTRVYRLFIRDLLVIARLRRMRRELRSDGASLKTFLRF